MTSLTEQGNTDLYTQQEAEGILNEWTFWNDYHDEWSNQYHDPNQAAQLLQEKIKRLLSQSEQYADDEENVIGQMIADTYVNHQKDVAENRQNSTMEGVGKAMVRGPALLWNGVALLGRELVDYENWFKGAEGIRNFFDETHAPLENRRRWEDWSEKKKRQGIKRNADGFWEAWGRGVGSPREFARYGVSPEEIDTLFQIDQIPWEGEDLGFWGNAVEILMQEAIIMGPLAVLKLRKASKIVDWFAHKSGAKGGKIIPDYKLNKERLITGEKARKMGLFNKEVQWTRTGDKPKSYFDIINEHYTGRGAWGEVLDEGRKKYYSTMMGIGSKEGSWLKFAGGSYAESELITSLTVAAAGASMQEKVGRGYSVIGEVGAGIFGARFVTGTWRYGADWVNWLRYRFGGLNNADRQNAFFRSMGYEIEAGSGRILDPEKVVGRKEDGTKIFAELPAKKRDQLFRVFTSRPGVLEGATLGVLRYGDRKKAHAYRQMAEMVRDLPDDISEELINRIKTLDSLVGRYDDGTGRLYASLAQAINFDVLATIQARALHTATLGKSVKLKLDAAAIGLQKRMADSATALSELIMKFPDEMFMDVNFANLMGGFRKSIKNAEVRLRKTKYKDMDNFMNVVKEADEQILTKTKKHLEIGEGTNTVSVGEDGRVKVGEEISGVDDVESTLSKADRKTIDKTYEKEGLYEITVGEKDGEKITDIWSKTGGLTKQELVKYEKASTKILDEAYKRDQSLGSKLYEGLGDKYKASLQDTNVSNSILTNIGESIIRTTGELPLGTRATAKVSMSEGNVNAYIVAKRKEALDKVNVDELEAAYKEMAVEANSKGRPFEHDNFGEIKNADGGTHLEALDLSDAGTVEKIKQEMAENVGVSLPQIAARNLDISLYELVTVRSSLYAKARQSFAQKGKRGMAGTDSFYDFQLADAVTQGLNANIGDDLIAGWKRANDEWYKTVGSRWRQGLGYKLIARNSQGDPMTGAGRLFDRFIDAKDDYGNASSLFESIFRTRRWDDKADDFIDDTDMFNDAVRLLDDAVIRRIDKSETGARSIDSGFWETFGDKNILDLKKKAGLKEDVVTPFDGIADSLYKSKNQKLKTVETKLSHIRHKADQHRALMEEELKDSIEAVEITDLGLTLEDLKTISGDWNETNFRQRLLDETYRGGNTEKAELVMQKLRDVEDKDAIKAFQKLLYDGAVEDAVSRSTKKFGSIYNPKDNTFSGNLSIDADVFATYMDKNRNVLEKFLSDVEMSDGTSLYDSMVELSSLATLIAGEITEATMEGLPKHFRVEQIISRVYSIARGVVSPRYVMTELLIQDARFRRGKLIAELATDPDAAVILSEVILKKGLRRPEIRKVFLNFWIESIIRSTRGDDSYGPGSKIAQIQEAKMRAQQGADLGKEIYGWGKGLIGLGE